MYRKLHCPALWNLFVSKKMVNGCWYILSIIFHISFDYSYQIWSSIMIISQESNVIRRMGFFASGELFQSFCWPHFEEKMLPPKFEKCCDVCFLYKFFRLSFFVKFGYSEKATIFEKIFHLRFDVKVQTF